MAEVNHTARARAGQPCRHPTNPLGRPHWLLSLADNPKQCEAAEIAGVCLGIHAISRILANSEAFRALLADGGSAEPGYVPLGNDVTEGLFAALYFLGSQAMSLTQPMASDPAFT